MVSGLSQCICDQAIDSIGVHLLYIATHDAIQDFFASIIRDVKFHVLHEQTHVF